MDFKHIANWGFLKGLNENSKVQWEVESLISNGTRKSFWNKLSVYCKYFLFPMKVFIHRKSYQNIIAWQQFYGIVLAFYCAVFRSKGRSPKISILTFIYKKKSGISGKIFHWFVNKALTYRNIEKVCVLSSYEVERYSQMFPQIAEKLYFTHFGLSEKDSGIVASKGDYFLSAGRSNRDYDFLVETFRLLDDKLVIISDTYKCSNLPVNVRILDHCFGKEYEEYVANCYAMIVSLCNEPISSGQLVALNGFKYKKPIIVTKNMGIVDYINNGKTGILIDKKPKALIDAITQIKNETTYAEMSSFIKGFSDYDYGKNIAMAVNCERNP